MQPSSPIYNEEKVQRLIVHYKPMVMEKGCSYLYRMKK
nr:MAG TPA: hypothetical protein [Caudoviricetes sp.]